jgi:hypothetical protein
MTFFSTFEHITQVQINQDKPPVAKILLIGLSCTILLASLSKGNFLELSIILTIIIGIITCAIIIKFRQKKILKYVCDKFGWKYGISNPDISTTLQQTFKTLPHGRPSLDCEIQGQLAGESFYHATYTSVIGSGKHRRTQTVYILATKLEKPIQVPFAIKREFLFSSKNDIQFESIEFSKQFEILYNPDYKQQIMTYITPSVQTTIVDLHKAYKLYSIEVLFDTLIITYAKNILWSFNLTTDISQKELEQIKQKMEKLLSLTKQLTDVIDKPV